MNPIEQTQQSQSNIPPEWARPSDITRMFGIKRTTLWNLLKEGRIRSASLRQRHQIRGTRVVNIQSVRDYLEAQSQSQ